MTDIITVPEHINLLIGDYLPVVDKYVYPLMARKGNGKYVLVGTCTTLTDSGRFFIATAGHTIQQFLENDYEVCIGTARTGKGGSVIHLQGSNPHWKLHPDEDKDLAILPLKSELGELDFFPTSKILRQSIENPTGHYFLAGYPRKRNNTYRMNMKTGKVISHIHPLMMKVDQSLSFDVNGKDPEKHLAFMYDRVVVDGIPQPQGVSLECESGAGLWYIPQFMNPESIMLAGILIEWHRDKIAYATLANYLQELI